MCVSLAALAFGEKNMVPQKRNADGVAVFDWGSPTKALHQLLLFFHLLCFLLRHSRNWC